MVHIVQHYLEQGFDVEHTDSHGVTPIWQAACMGHLAVVQLFIDRGADVAKANVDGDNLLHWALAPRWDRLSTWVEGSMLLDCDHAIIGKVISAVDAPPGNSSFRGRLTQAILYKLVDIMQHLDVKGSLGRTLLSLAAEGRYWQVINNS